MAITISGSGITSSEIADGTITNADINASAAIVASKLSGTGKVLQVVSVGYSTTVSMSSTTHIDTGLTATITPTFSTSKILVLVHQNGLQKHLNSTPNDITIYLKRGASTISIFANFLGFTNTATHLYAATASSSYLDSPATTSATTYKTTFANPDGGGSGGTVYVQQAGAESTITLMEIGA
jgi:hypothetical protein